MRAITFDQFVKDYNVYYGMDLRKIVLRSYLEIQVTCYDLYNTDDLEIDFENELIEIYS